MMMVLVLRTESISMIGDTVSRPMRRSTRHEYYVPLHKSNRTDLAHVLEVNERKIWGRSCVGSMNYSGYDAAGKGVGRSIAW